MKVPMKIVKIKNENGSFISEEVKRLGDTVDGRSAFSYLLLPVPTSGFLYPGSYGNLDKVIVNVDPGGEVDLSIVTKVDPLLRVLDPKKVTAEAIAYLKRHHEAEVKLQFLHKVFHNNYMVLPNSEIVIVRSEKNRDYVLCGGCVWEILANDQLLPLQSLPKETLVDISMGERAARTSTYSYVSHAVYSEDVSFE